MGIFNDIQNALNNKLSSIPLIPKIFYSNVDTDDNRAIPTHGIPYLRPTLMPANSTVASLDGKDYHRGIYQIDIYTQLKKGSAPILIIADQIRTAFKNADLVSNSNIIHITSISISNQRRDESFWTCHVQINYFCVA